MNNEELLKRAEEGDREAMQQLQKNLQAKLDGDKTEATEPLQEVFFGTYTANEWLKENRNIRITALDIRPEGGEKIEIVITYLPQEGTEHIYQLIMEKDVGFPIRMSNKASVEEWKERHEGWVPIHSTLYRSGRDRTLYLNFIIPIPLETMKETTVTLAVMPYSEYRQIENKMVEEKKKDSKESVLLIVFVVLGILLAAAIILGALAIAI